MVGDLPSFGSVRINGYRMPISRPQDYEYDPTRGLTVTQEWEGAGPDSLDGRARRFISERKAFRFSKNKTRSRLVMTASNSQLGYPEVSTDTWQILANEVSKDIRELPVVASLPENLYTNISNQATEWKAGDSIFDTFQPPTGLSGDDLAAANIIFDLLIKGQDQFAFSQYVLKHTTSVSNAAVANVSDFGVGAIYTTSQLLNEVEDSSSWTYPLPGRLSAKIGSISSPATKLNYLWGWRKLPSTETTTANFRIEISTEYWLDQWSTFIYFTA